MESERNSNVQAEEYRSGADTNSPEDKSQGNMCDSSERNDRFIHEQHSNAGQTTHDVTGSYIDVQQARESPFNVHQQQVVSEQIREDIRGDIYSRNEQYIQNVTSAEEFIQRFKHSLPSMVESRLQYLPEAAQVISNNSNNVFPYVDPNMQRGLVANAPLHAPQLDDYRSKLDMINAGLFVRSAAPVVSTSHYEAPQLDKQSPVGVSAQTVEDKMGEGTAVNEERTDSPHDVHQQAHCSEAVVDTPRETPYVPGSVGGLGQASEAAAVAYAAQAVAAAVAQQHTNNAHADVSGQPVKYSEQYLPPPVTHVTDHSDKVDSDGVSNSENGNAVRHESESMEDLPTSETDHDSVKNTDTHVLSHHDKVSETYSYKQNLSVQDPSTEVNDNYAQSHHDKVSETGSYKQNLSVQDPSTDPSTVQDPSTEINDNYAPSHHDKVSEAGSYDQTPSVQDPSTEIKDNYETPKEAEEAENVEPENVETKGENTDPELMETKVEKDEIDESVTFKEEPADAVPRVTRSKSGRTKSTPVKKWSKTCKCCENTFKNEEEFNHHVVVNLGKNESLLVYKCLACCQCFDAMSDLRAHAEIHKEGVLCMICDQPFRTRSDLELHLSSHNCGPILPESIKNIEAVNGHDSDATVDNDYGSDGDDNNDGGTLLDDPREILKHINLDLKQEPSSEFDDTDKDPSYRSKRRKGGKGQAKFKCKYCGKRYRSQGCLKNHLQKCSAERPALTCKYCSKTFQDETNWKRHEGMHLGIRPHKCPHCDKAYSKKSHLNVHIQTHEGKKRPFPCDQCDKSFSDSHNLKRHKMRHTGERPYPCSICDKRFSDKSDLNMHQKYHLGDRPHKCPDCDKAYVKRSHLVQHMAVHSGERKFKCEYCDRAYHSAQACKRHEMTHTGEKPYQCSYCEKRFVESADRKYHEIAQHGGERPHKCSFCEKTFVRKGHLNTHLLSHKGERNHKCETCSKAFTTPYGLKKHKLIHSGEKHLACEYCGKLFRESRNLKVHLMTHTGEKPHGCADCDKRFITAGELKMHMRVHTGEKPNTCEFCGMVFSQKGNLQRHLLRHTGERPLKCELCGKGFIEKQELNAHILNHNGLKPFKCEHCGIGFTRKHHLKKHYRTHTGYKPHTCEFCGKTFSERYNLQTHRVIHTGVKPHPCPFCSIGFIRKGHLIKHVKEAHPGQELDDTPKYYIERGPNVPNPPNLPAIINVKKASPSHEALPQLDPHNVDESLEPMDGSSSEHPPPPPQQSTPSFEKQAEAAREADNSSMGAYQQESPYRRPYLPEVELPHAYPQLHPSLMQQYGGNMANMANMAASMLPMNAATQENLINHMSRLSEMHPGAFPNPNMFPL